jgi:hypothetical protein
MRKDGSAQCNKWSKCGGVILRVKLPEETQAPECSSRLIYKCDRTIVVMSQGALCSDPSGPLAGEGTTNDDVIMIRVELLTIHIWVVRG